MAGKNFNVFVTERNNLKGGDTTMRTNLKIFRVRRGLTMEKMAARIGCGRSAYSAIESGKRNGRMKFWYSLQTAFEVEDTELGELMRNE